MDILKLDVTVGENMEEDVLKILSTVQTSWEKADINVQIFTDGITNRLLGCRHQLDTDESDVVIVRVFGENTELIVDREAELQNMQLMHLLGCARPVYAQFNNGLAYGFVPGVCLDGNTVKDPHIARLIAREMVTMHSMDPESVASGHPRLCHVDKRPCIFTKIEKYIAVMPDGFSDADKDKIFKQGIPSKAALLAELEDLKCHLEKLNSPVVFAHNDLLLKNIVYSKDEDRTYFIDFEYGGFNYEAYDIGTHFCEYAGIKSVDHSRFPTKVYQLSWLRNFLEFKFQREGKSVEEITEVDLERLYVQVNKFTLLAHLFWGLWLVIQASVSKLDPNYLRIFNDHLLPYFADKLTIELFGTNKTSAQACRKYDGRLTILSEGKALKVFGICSDWAALNLHCWSWARARKTQDSEQYLTFSWLHLYSQPAAGTVIPQTEKQRLGDDLLSTSPRIFSLPLGIGPNDRGPPFKVVIRATMYLLVPRFEPGPLYCKASVLPTRIKWQMLLRFLQWAKGHKNLKVVSSPVPPGILPLGIAGTLHDIKVNPSRHGPDDALYDASKELRAKVARGNCLLELYGGGDGVESFHCLVYAMKKFTGGLGDDDDRDRGDNHTWKKYFTKPLSETHQVVCTKKANGEAAHLSAISVSGHTLLCTGSKNVHMLLKNREDIDLYTGDRYRIAKDVAHTVMDLVESMDKQAQDRLLQFLCVTRYTGVFEILAPDHQHVVDLSDLNRPELRFIAWTSCNLDPAAGKDLCVMPPHAAIELCRCLGVPTVDYDIIGPSDVTERFAQIRRDYNSEGEVLYFVDNASSVIGLLKKKTIWYIICRAIREKVRGAGNMYMKSPATFEVQRTAIKIQKRLCDIQSWLGLDDAAKEAWTELGIKFLKWCIHHLETGTITPHQIADLFPVTWKKFLSESGMTDEIKVQWTEPEGSDD